MDKTKEMTQEREAAILEGAINKWGNTMQITVAIEELSELQKALCKCLRYLGSDHHENGKYPPDVLSSIREEIADVSIMLNQLELIFGDCAEVEIAKLERLEKMVGIVPQQTLAHQEPNGTWALNDPPPDFAVSPWTPEDVKIAMAVRELFPQMRYIGRLHNKELYVTRSLAPATGSVSEFITLEAFSCLLPGDAVLIDDILAAGGGEQ